MLRPVESAIRQKSEIPFSCVDDWEAPVLLDDLVPKKVFRTLRKTHLSFRSILMSKSLRSGHCHQLFPRTSGALAFQF